MSRVHMDNRPSFHIDEDELELFGQDVNEQLRALEAGILGLEKELDPETLNSTFRAAHTLKAIAGVVGHQPMAELTHAIETLLDSMREGQLSPTPEMTDELLDAVDVIRMLRDEVLEQKSGGLETSMILGRLRALGATRPESAPNASAAPPAKDPPPYPQSIQVPADLDLEALTLLEIEVSADPESFAPAARLLQAALAMEELGHILIQDPSTDDLLADQHDGHLWLLLATEGDTPSVEVRLATISELIHCEVQPYAGPAEFEISPSSGSPIESETPFEEINQKLLSDAISQRWDDFADLTELSAQPTKAATEPQLSSAIPTTSKAPSRRPSRSFQRRGSNSHQQAKENEKTVRISVERLDTLMDLVGEMVTDRTRLEQIENTLRSRYGKAEAMSTLDGTISHLGQVIDQLQNEVMRARMLPLSRLFHKFPRLVRDVSRAAGKQVHLEIRGEATELDRSIMEAIDDPLIHLLRNAVDHGIETPQERKTANKAPFGVLKLSAEHIEGQIVITVSDDGQGIDPALIRQTAVQKGLLAAEEAEQLSNDESINLIFRPGLSTAQKITDVSGRGVGLDIVRANISRIGGSVTVESEINLGTSFRITLPLTLATVQTMLVQLGTDVYAIPLTSIIESIYQSDVATSSIKGYPAIRWRERVLPLLDLSQFFERGAATAAVAQGEHAAKPAVVVVAWGKLHAGLMVNRILRKQEVVAKPLGTIIGNVPGLSGCTILGNGHIALIVDVPSVINLAMQAQAQKTRQSQKQESA